VSDDLRPSLLALCVAYDGMQEEHEDNEKQETTVSETSQDTHRLVDAHHQTHHAPRTKLVAELGTRPRGVRPVELAQAMGIELGPVRRTCQWIERDGSKFEPLDTRMAVAATVERAS
jgi:hypothetical protein